MKLLIKNSLILTVNPQNEVFENADIAIENGCLLAVGKVPENFEAEKVIDATDQIAMPGLVNAHTHIPMSLFRNYADDLPFGHGCWKRLNRQRITSVPSMFIGVQNLEFWN